MKAIRENDIFLVALLNQRNVLYNIRLSEDVNRSDLEILAYSRVKQFFSSYNLKLHFPHTNVQMIKESLLKLEKQKLIESIHISVGRRPTRYIITTKGKAMLNKFSQLMFDECFNED